MYFEGRNWKEKRTKVINLTCKVKKKTHIQIYEILKKEIRKNDR